MLFSATWLLLAVASLRPANAAPTGGSGAQHGNALDRRLLGININLNPLCNILPSSLGRDVCQACIAQFKDPYAKTCTVAALTSCTSGRFVSNGKSCVTTCPANYHPDASKLICIPDAVCKANEYLSADKNSCVKCADSRATKCDASGLKACGFGLVPSGNTCVCPSGTYETSPTSCASCTSAFGPNVATCSPTAVKTCSDASFTIDNNKCVCGSNQLRTDSSCQTCPSGSFCDGSKTSTPCSTKFGARVASCTANEVSTCDATFSRDSENKSCVCTGSESLINDKCVACTTTFGDNVATCTDTEAKTCSDASFTISENKCVCGGDQLRTDSSCQTCPSGSFCDGSKTSTPCTTKFGAHVATCTANEVSTCDETFSRDSENKSCVCTGSESLINDKCVACTTTFGDNVATCTDTEAKTCSDASFTISQNKCVCGSTQLRTDSSCQTCPSGSFCDGSKTSTPCTTKFGAHVATCTANEVSTCDDTFSRDSENKSCVCTGSESLINDKCVACTTTFGDNVATCTDTEAKTCSDASFTISENKCVCGGDQLRTDSSCQTCPAGSFCDGSKTSALCTSKFGAHVATCTANEVSTCDDSFSRDSENKSCVCTGSESLINDKCVACTTTFGDNVATCTDTEAKTCSDASFTISQNKCVCGSTQLRTDSSCQTCPSGSFCDGSKTSTLCTAKFGANVATCTATEVSTCNPSFSRDTTKQMCICASNQQIVNGQCSACPTNAFCDGKTATACTTKYGANADTCSSTELKTCLPPFVVDAAKQSCISCPSGSSAVNGVCSPVTRWSTRLVTYTTANFDYIFGSTIAQCMSDAPTLYPNANYLFFHGGHCHANTIAPGTGSYRTYFKGAGCPNPPGPLPANSACTELYIVPATKRCYLNEQLTQPCPLFSDFS